MKINKLISLRSDFSQNISTLFIGTLIAQLIPIILQVYLRRVYSPLDFGNFALYSNFVAILIIIAGLRFEMAIIIPKHEDEAEEIFIFTLFLNVFSFLLFFILILFFNNWLITFLNLSNYKGWLFFTPFGVLVLSVYNTINYYLIRKKKFKSITINRIARRATEGIFQIIFGYFLKYFGLFISDIFGNLSNILSGIYQLDKFRFKISIGNAKRIFFKYINFPLYNMLPALLDTISVSIPIFLINKFYNSQTVGQFDLSRQILAVPIALIAKTIAQVFFQRVAEKKNSGISIKYDFFKITSVLFIIGIFEVVIIFFAGESIFRFVFGSSWIPAGSYSRILIFSSLFVLVVSPMSMILIALEKLKLVAIWQIIYFLLTLCLFFFRSVEIKTFLFVNVIIDILCYTVYFIIILNTVLKYENKLLKK